MRQGRKKPFDIVMTVVVIVAAGVFGTVSLMKWRPLKEGGTASQGQKLTPMQSNSQSNERVSPQPQWSSDFTNFLVCGIDNTNSLTDVIMIVGFDNKTKKVSILQIPRDTYAGSDIPTRKYNAVYGHHDKGVSGMETLKARVENDFGIEIGNYAAVTTKGFRTLVDAAGGVEVNVPIDMDYDDDKQDLHIHISAGKQTLNGSQAEQFVRFRKGWKQGDLGRLDAQKIFLASFAKKLQSLGVWKISAEILPVIKQPDFLTDLSIYDMLELASAAKQVSLSSAKIYTMPGEPYTSKDGTAYYSAHKKELLAILNADFVPNGITLKLDDLKIKQKMYKEASETDSSSFENILSK